VGFTGLVEEVLDLYAHSMIPQAMAACRATASAPPEHRFTWTLPAWLLKACLERTASDPFAAELEALIREGRITWHALPFTTHTELFGLEDFIRGLFVARALGERFGRRAVAAKMTDVPGHTWILPTVLASAGVRFLHLGCNACSTPPDVPFLFRWEGPDGSRVTTMYSRGGYGTSLFPPADWNLPIWLALQHTLDNAGPHNAAALDRILADAREHHPGARVVVGSLDDFARELESLQPDLPVVRKDLADSWIHGVGTMPSEVSRLRAARNRLASVESAMALRDVWKRSQEPVPAEQLSLIRSIYEKILLFGEHTWGMDTKIALNPPEFGGRVYVRPRFEEVLASGRYERIRRSWSDKARFAGDAEVDVGRLEAMASRSADGPGGLSGASGLPARLDVVNHQPWSWNGLLRLGRANGPVRITNEASGTVLPGMLLEGDAWVRVAGLPPLSQTTLHIEADESRQQPPAQETGRRVRAGRTSRRRPRRLALDNARLRVEVDPAAGMTALIDRATGRNWAARKGRVPFGAYRYDVFSRREIVGYLRSYAYDLESWFLDDFGKPGYPEGDHLTFFGEPLDARIESAPGWQRIRLQWKQEEASVKDLGNAAMVTQTITLFDDLPWVDMDVGLQGKKECPLLEAGHVVLSLEAENPRYAISRTGSVIDPAVDLAVDANRLLHCCDRWVDVTDAGSGLLVIPFDSPLFSIGSIAIERFDGSALPGAPVLNFNLFNTQWGTNFPQWIGGSFRFSYRIIPHRGDWRDACVWEHASAALQPPACLPANGSAAVAPGLLARQTRGLQTTAIKHAEAGDGVIWRFQEAAGRRRKQTLHFRCPEGQPTPAVVQCSLLEDEVKVLQTVRSGDAIAVEIAMRPFEIVTLKLRPTPRPG